MSSSVFPHRFRPLIVATLAIGMICSGFSLPLITSAEAAAGGAIAVPAFSTCCCGLDGSCQMGCCVLQTPAVPDAPIPASRSTERPPTFSVLLSQPALLSSALSSVPCASRSVRAGDLLVETSLQSLQVRLDI